MGTHRIVEVAGPPLGPELGSREDLGGYLHRWGSRGKELYQLLRNRNGFYAYESSLLVRGFGSPAPPRDLDAWNSDDGWIKLYDAFRLDRMLFFGEDVFGTQFAVTKDDVLSFDPETASVDRIAGSIDEWGSLILTDYTYYTGFPVAHEWQTRNGLLPPGMKLVPRVPFACGGDFSAGNMAVLEEFDSMAFRANLANQMKDLPDGTPIQFKIE